MPCPVCGTENEAGRKFCGECGNPLVLACPNCGTPITSATKFCGECGAPLAAGASPPASALATPSPVREAPTAERRLVSVLFADLVGFTALSESRDAEDVRELLSKYFETCDTLISRYGGVVEKFIGDAVMAVWGTPVATEDDAERAVRAALDLTKAVTELGAEAGAPDLRARAGVLTGEAAVTLGATGQGMVAGDMVNTASRIQSAAPPGAVFVGESTKRATEATVAYEDAGLFELKGKAEPVPLWRATRVVAGVRGTLKSVGLEPPFVGRDRELRMAKELFHASSDKTKAHLVSVTGIAGIGKSRLSWEFYKYFDGLQKEVFYHRGRCLSYGEGVTYWALAEMVKMRAQIAEEEEPASALSKLRATIADVVPDPDERRWVEPRLAHLLGLEERTAANKEDLFAGWRLFFERMAERDPVVMVFEDMQWADVSLLDFVEYLLEWSRNHPIFILTLARPELTDNRPTWGAGKRNFTSLYLEPLSEEAMHALISGLVPGLPEEVEKQVLERAQGVPLYAVETVRMLLDRGLLVREGPIYRPIGPIGSLEVPETLHALIAARLDGLAPLERRVVQDASVLGKSFFKAGVAAVSRLSEEELEPVLASLVHKEVFSVLADPRSPERGQYAFLQDLLKTVAYEGLAKKDRKTKHLAVARFIQETWTAEEDEIVEVVASHYLNAYRAAPDADDAPEIRATTKDMLVKAGERAASLAAAGEAERYFTEAGELAEGTSERAELLERAGVMAYQAGRMTEARSLYEEALASFEAEDLFHPAARVSARLGDVDWAESRLAEAIERMERAFVVLEKDEPDEDMATFAAQLGRLHYFKGDTIEALERIDLALDIAEALALPEVLSQALNTKGIILGFRSHREESMALLTRALDVALENDIAPAALRAYNNLAEVIMRRDRFNDAIELYSKGMALARRVGDRFWELQIVSEVAYPRFLTGRWDDAIEEARSVPEPEMALANVLGILLTLPQIHAYRGNVEEAERFLSIYERFETSEDVQESASHAVARAVVHGARGRWVEQLAAAEAAVGFARSIGPDSHLLKEGIGLACEAGLALGDFETVGRYLAEIEALRPGQTTISLRALGARFRARLAAARGSEAEVEPRFKEAAGLLRELGGPFYLAVALTEYGEWLATSDRAEEAAPLLDEARGIFEDLKARPWLERVESLQHAGAALPAS